MNKYKKEDNISYALGTTLTLYLLDSHINDVLRVYVHSKQEHNDTYNKIVNICNKNNIEIIESDKIFHTLSDKDNCYIIGVFKKFDTKIDFNANHLVLVNPSNMGNLGTIIRTAVGFGITNLIIVKPAVDIFDPKVVRASMGALFNINFKYYDNFSDYQKDISNRTLYPFILNGENNLSTVKKDNTYSLIFGNEATGLPDEFDHIGTTIRINHNNKIDSLNLDNAVSIGLYEFTKDNFVDKK